MKKSESATMKFCSTCGEAMIKAEVYDPDGVIPLSMEIDGADLWVCIRCSKLTAAELFGDDKDILFKRLAKLVHPDMVGAKMKASAHEAFTKLGRFYAEANGKTEPFSATKIGSWIVKGPLAKGEIADLYDATSDKHEEAAFKIARMAKDNDLMEAEAESLKRLWKSAQTDNFKKYLPQLFDTFK